MKTNSKLSISAHLVAASLLLITVAPVSAAANFLYAQTNATQSYTTFIGPVPISGLSLNLPAASAAFNTAVVTLNMPNLYLDQPTSKTIPMSATIELVAPFAPHGLSAASGGIGCDTTTVKVSGRKPMTIVLKVPLGNATQLVEAEWDSTEATVVTDGFASISAILVRE